MTRIADEINARAFAVSGITGDVDQLLVSLSGDVAVGRILDFVEELVGERESGVTLFLAGEKVETTDRLDTAAERLREAGLSVRTQTADGSPFNGLMDAVVDHDAIVMGEKAPSFRSFVFGDEADRVASASVGPALVVRYDEVLDR